MRAKFVAITSIALATLDRCWTRLGHLNRHVACALMVSLAPCSSLAEPLELVQSGYYRFIAEIAD